METSICLEHNLLLLYDCLKNKRIMITKWIVVLNLGGARRRAKLILIGLIARVARHVQAS